MAAKLFSKSLAEAGYGGHIASAENLPHPESREAVGLQDSANYESAGEEFNEQMEHDDMDSIKEADFGDAGALLSPTISRFQTKMASVTTPASEKEAVIREGDGYFSFPSSTAAIPVGTDDSQGSSEANSSGSSSPSESPIRKSVMDSTDHSQTNNSLSSKESKYFVDLAGQNVQTSNNDFAPGSLVQTTDGQTNDNIEMYKNISSSQKNGNMEDLHTFHSMLQESLEYSASPPRYYDEAHRPSFTKYQMPSEGSLKSYHRSLSRASSLGDDERFGHIKKQVNNRSKAFWDSMPSPSFHLQIPSLPFPSFAKVLSSFPNNANSSSETSKKSPVEVDTNRSTSNAGLGSGITLYPAFSKAIEQLEGDLVILGGYRGSILKSAKSPFQRIWPPPLSAMVDMSTVDLEVGFEEDSEAKAAEEVKPDGMIKNFGPIDISKRLFKRLRTSANFKSGKLRVHDYSYDWRLSPTRLSEEFITFLEGLECNSTQTPIPQRGAVVIAHSLGGLFTRYAVNKKPHLFAGVVYAGTPQHAVNILGPFKFNDSVFRSTRILTAQTNFSVRTSFALLPTDGRCFVDEQTKEELPVDFFNVEDWIKYRLSPCISTPLPPSNPPSSKSILESITSTIPLIGRRTSTNKDEDVSVSSSNDESSSGTTKESATVEKIGGFAPQLDSRDRSNSASYKPNYLPITLSREKAIEYLTRTLSEVKAFKLSLAHRPEHSKTNVYPPLAVVYGKSEPTVRSCKVRGYEAIGCIDVYKDENLLFGSGDGVVLSRSAMLPEGYKAARGGVVGTNRGHVTLLADLEAIGKALGALSRARRHGVGNGAVKIWEEKMKGEDAVKASE